MLKILLFIFLSMLNYSYCQILHFNKDGLNIVEMDKKLGPLIKKDLHEIDRSTVIADIKYISLTSIPNENLI